jgi:hypothetical protein
MKKLLLFLICAAIFVTQSGVDMNDIKNDVTLYKIKRYEVNKLEDAANNQSTFNGIKNVVLDGSGEEFHSLCNEVAAETNILPKSIINDFNSSGFTLVVSDDISRWSSHKSQEIAPGQYISGFTHIGPLSKEIVILPYNGDDGQHYSSLYHEIGHATVYMCDIDTKELFNVFKFDSESIETLTGQYAGSGPQECWAEAFEYMVLNINDPEKMDEAQKLMPVAYHLFTQIINQEIKE